ncbi:MAG: hypothetical protein OXU20_31780 [Myxococcales bacterium]|nr:hypothetical protein [Myxococcales bacterium]
MLRRVSEGWLVGGVIAGLACAWPYTVDDAYIVGRYAHNLAHGHGYTMNPGQAPSDGLTGPLWVLPGALAALLGADPVQALKWLGGLCTGLSALIVMRRQRRRRLGDLAAPIAAALYVTQPTTATWAVAGLGTGAAALLIVLAAGTPRGTRVDAPVRWPSMVAAATVGWLRPEMLPVVAVMVLLPALASRKPQRRALAWYGGGLFVGLSAIVGFRLTCFGDALPLSVRAKPAELSNGVEYVLRALPWLTGGGGLWLVACAYRWGRSRDRLSVVGLVAGVMCIALAGGDWMPGFRLFAPLIPVYAGLAGIGFARAYGKGRRTGALLSLALAVAIPSVDWALRLPQLRNAAEGRRVALELAHELRARGRSMALVDIGLLTYASGLPTLDLGGITDPQIGDLPGGHLDKRLPEALLREQAPDLIVLHARSPPRVSEQGRLLALSGYPVERRVASMAWVQRTYRVFKTVAYTSNYHYVVMIARSRGLPD